MKLMKITNEVLFLTLDTFSNTGGIQKVCRALAKALAERKAKHPYPNQFRLLSLCDTPQCLMEEYIPKSQFRGFKNNRIRFILSALTAGLRSRTIILSHINLLPVAFLIKLFISKKRIVMLAHGIEVWRDPGKWRKNFMNKHMELWAVSEFTGDYLHHTIGIKRTNIHVLTNCLDPFLMIPQTFGKPARLLERHHLNAAQPVILTVTRLSSYERDKGYDLVIGCLPDLVKTYPSLMYLLAGKCDVEEALRLTQLINRLNLHNHVKLVGYIPEKDITDYYLLCDVFLLPSKKEGFGLVLIEAAACGSRIIAGSKDGSINALHNGQLGTLINPDSSTDLIQAIDAALTAGSNLTDAYSRQRLTKELFGFERYRNNVETLLS
jgi:glycosyltransferase involved in cell wall biosynthesis